MTPRQACPRPEGLGRNLRSKTRWFTGFCNSHQVSHFATFFIDARAEISVAESRMIMFSGRCLAARAKAHVHPVIYVPWRMQRRGFVIPYHPRTYNTRSLRKGKAGFQGGRACPTTLVESVYKFTVFRSGIDNDPSAGSPTETLLRLLLPLNDKVQWTSCDVTGGEPLASPRSEHFTGPFNR